MADSNRTETLEERPQEKRLENESLHRQQPRPETTLPQPRPGHDEELEPTDADDESRDVAKGSRGRGNYLRQHPLAMLLLIVVAIVAVGAGVYFWIESLTWESTDDAQVETHIASISARISGHVVKAYVEDGQPVRANDPLVDIDPTDYQVALTQARANLAEAVANAQAAGGNIPITAVNTSQQIQSSEAGVGSAEAGISAAEKNYAAAQANVRLAQANSVKAQSDLERYKQLVAKDEISKQQYDQAIAAAEAAAATVDSAKAEATAAQQQVAQARERLRQAQADWKNSQTAPKQMAVVEAHKNSAEALVEKNQALLDQAQHNLDYTHIVAPLDGIIGRRSVEVGQNVQPGQEMMSLVPIKDLWVTANFKETQVRKMKVGQQVKIHIDALGNDLNGRVQYLPAASGSLFSLLPPENATGNYVKVVQRLPVRISIDAGQDAESRLRPGMSVETSVKVR
jgi:membrane fusion protein (multidrug efflux system)